MPISEIQSEVLRRIAANRNPESYLAGATVIHREADTPRYSRDLDFFHDLADSVAASARKDVATLGQAGYEVRWLLRAPSIHRAVVSVDRRQLTIEWAQDSAFRFFPIQEDECFGYRLHDADAAVNKVLALAGRDEVRDFVDVIYLHSNYLSLGALAWAACGKDPGYTPEFLLEHASRHTAYRQADLDRLDLRVPLEIKSLKKSWLEALDEARKLVISLPAEEIGCLYLDLDRIPVTPDPSADSSATLIRHRGSVRGAWPVIDA